MFIDIFKIFLSKNLENYCEISYEIFRVQNVCDLPLIFNKRYNKIIETTLKSIFSLNR